MDPSSENGTIGGNTGACHGAHRIGARLESVVGGQDHDVQGNLGDGDMHGGQQFIPLMDIEIQ
jgi:hypothetical protein